MPAMMQRRPCIAWDGELNDGLPVRIFDPQKAQCRLTTALALLPERASPALGTCKQVREWDPFRSTWAL